MSGRHTNKHLQQMSHTSISLPKIQPITFVFIRCLVRNLKSNSLSGTIPNSLESANSLTSLYVLRSSWTLANQTLGVVLALRCLVRCNCGSCYGMVKGEMIHARDLSFAFDFNGARKALQQAILTSDK